MNNYTKAAMGELLHCIAFEKLGSEFIKPDNWQEIEKSLVIENEKRPYIFENVSKLVNDVIKEIPNKVWWSGQSRNDLPVELNPLLNPSDLLFETSKGMNGISLKEGLKNKTLKNLGSKTLSDHLNINFDEISEYKKIIEDEFFPNEFTNRKEREKWYKDNKELLETDIHTFSQSIFKIIRNHIHYKLSLIDESVLKDFLLSVCFNACENKCKKPEYMRLYFDESKMKIESPYEGFSIDTLKSDVKIFLQNKGNDKLIIGCGHLPMMCLRIKYGGYRLCSSIKINCDSLIKG